MTRIIPEDSYSVTLFIPPLGGSGGPAVVASAEDITVTLQESVIDVEVTNDIIPVLQPDTILAGLEEVLNVTLVEDEVSVSVEDEIDVILLADDICVCYDEGT